MLNIEDARKITKLKQESFKQDKIVNSYLKRIDLRIKKAAKNGYWSIEFCTIFIDPTRINAIINIYKEQGYYVLYIGNVMEISWRVYDEIH